MCYLCDPMWLIHPPGLGNWMPFPLWLLCIPLCFVKRALTECQFLNLSYVAGRNCRLIFHFMFIFWGSQSSFPVSAPFYIFLNWGNYGRVTISPHPTGCEVASCWSFDLHFCNDWLLGIISCAWWLLVHFLWGNVCWSHLLILKLDYFIIEL